MAAHPPPATSPRGTGLIAAIAAATTLLLALTVLQDPHPTATPHVPWWLLAAAFAVTSLDTFRVRRDRRLLGPPLARIPLVIGLYLANPVELLVAQQLGTAVVLSGRFRRAPAATAYALAGSGLATAVGGWVYLGMTDMFAPQGPDGWLDGIVAAVAAVLVLAALATVRSAPRPLTPTTALRWVRAPLAADVVAAATGLVAAEIIRTDRYAVWLLVLPSIAALGLLRQHELSEWRADALATLHDAANRIHRTRDTERVLALAVDQARSMTRAGAAWLLLSDPEQRVLVAHQDDGGTAVRMRAERAADRAMLARLEAAASVTTGSVDDRPATRAVWPWDRNLDQVVVPVREQGTVTGAVGVSHRRGKRGFHHTEVQALETLAAVLGRTMETARQLNGLEDRLAHDSRVVERLQRVNRDLERVSHAKTVFLATTSHELRAPLTALLAEAELIAAFAGQDGRERECRQLAAGVDVNARHLLRLVDDLLDLSRIEAGQLELRLREIDLATVADDVVTALGPLAAHQGVELTHTNGIPAPMVGDADRLWQVIANLVRNATRAAAPSGSVQVVTTLGSSGPEVQVSDTGIGIHPDDVERIFAPFERGQARDAGLGLGLTIARHLVEQHGGRLSVTSTPAVGSSFTATFPWPDGGPTPRGAARSSTPS